MDHQAFAQLLGNYGEFLGSIAVLATVFYLALQIKQYKQNLSSSTAQNSGDGIVVFASLGYLASWAIVSFNRHNLTSRGLMN